MVVEELSCGGAARVDGRGCRDDGLLAAVGGRGGLIRTGRRVDGARDQPAPTSVLQAASPAARLSQDHTRLA